MQNRRVILEGRRAVERWHALVKAGFPLFVCTHMLITVQALLYISNVLATVHSPVFGLFEQTQTLVPMGWIGKR